MNPAALSPARPGSTRSAVACRTAAPLLRCGNDRIHKYSARPSCRTSSAAMRTCLPSKPRPASWPGSIRLLRAASRSPRCPGRSQEETAALFDRARRAGRSTCRFQESRTLGDVLLYDAIKTIATAPIASHATLSTPSMTRHRIRRASGLRQTPPTGQQDVHSGRDRTESHRGAMLTNRIRVVKHEVVPRCGSYEVQAPDGRESPDSSRTMVYRAGASRSSCSAGTARERKAFARAERDKGT